MRSADAAILILALVAVWGFIRAQRDPNFNFDLFDLVMERGRVSRTAFAFVLTLAVTSWVIVRLTLDGKLSDLLFGAYLTAWVAPIVAKMFSGNPPAGTTVTDTKTETHMTEIPKETL